jgi:hypothetical protein
MIQVVVARESGSEIKKYPKTFHDFLAEDHIAKCFVVHMSSLGSSEADPVHVRLRHLLDLLCGLNVSISKGLGARFFSRQFQDRFGAATALTLCAIEDLPAERHRPRLRPPSQTSVCNLGDVLETVFC